MSVSARLRRRAQLPDPLRVARSRRAPEAGPRILFFSGGSALRPLARALKGYTHHSTHLVTPFDSGGSSAVLREAFGMLSVGDLRNRLLALADEGAGGQPQACALLSQRLPPGADEALRQLERMASGRHAQVAAIPTPLRRILCHALERFCAAMPRDLDLRDASVGNLVLASAYLERDRDIEAALFEFSSWVEARGIVHPTCDADLHLAATLEDGTRVVGQHRLTGKSEPPIGSRVTDLWLVGDLERAERAEVALPERSAELIERADLVCYPPGSFYSSVVANLLPKGAGAAIRSADVPKLYIPNTGADPEQFGMSVADALEELIHRVRADAGPDTPVERIVDLLLVDSRHGRYATPLDLRRVERLGVQVVDLELVRDPAAGLDPERLCDVLVSLA